MNHTSKHLLPFLILALAGCGTAVEPMPDTGTVTDSDSGNTVSVDSAEADSQTAVADAADSATTDAGQPDSGTVADDAGQPDVQVQPDVQPTDGADAATTEDTDACAAGETLCNGTCVNLQNDPTNCGVCRNACQIMANATATCTAGACQLPCNAGFSLCGNVCVNLMNDPLNCGACGTNVGLSVCVDGMSVDCSGAGDSTRCNGSDVCRNPSPQQGTGCTPGVSCDGNVCGGTVLCPDGRTNLHCDATGFCWCT